MDYYLKEPISNGNPREQALIRKWWHEKMGAKGTLVWEYCLEDRYLDAVLFLNNANSSIEAPGKNVAVLHPIKDETVILCEAKENLNPELIGQAIVYKQLALHAGAIVAEVIIFSERASESMYRVAKELGLTTEVLSNV